ncbi:hypothetical protein IWQ55_004784 [Labrenzia sp. EL_208]|nr:hypothetical protein [Labrenzia sp. EL_132]MBG6231555.1 hypothetical protein [Labrenzia sp. EL_208]
MIATRADILTAIRARSNIPTYVIRNVLVNDMGWPKCLKTSQILAACKSLEGFGEITRTGMSSNSICWSIANSDS